MPKVRNWAIQHARPISVGSVVGSFVLLGIAIGMSLAILIAGGSNGFMDNCNIMTVNASKIGQNVLANSTVFFLNSSNPLFNFATGIKLNASASNTTALNPSALGTFGSEPSGGVVEPALEPVIDGLTDELLDAVSPVLRLSPGSPVPDVLHNVTRNALEAIDTGIVVFIKNVTSSVIQNVFAEFTQFLLGNNSDSGTPAGMAVSSLPATTPAVAGASSASTSVSAVQKALEPRQDPFGSLTSLAGGLTSILPGATTASASTSGSPASTAPAASTSPAATQSSSNPLDPLLGGGLEGGLGGILGGDGGGIQIPDSVENALGDIIYNLIRTVIAEGGNSAVQTILQLVKSTGSEPQSPLIKNITDKLGPEIRDIANRDLNSVANSSTKAFGVPDFYSIHISRYCFGQYVALDGSTDTSPNAGQGQLGIDTSSPKSFRKDVQGCSNVKDIKTFNLAVPLQKSLNAQGVPAELPPIHLPAAITKNISLLEALTSAVYAFEVLGVVLGFLSYVAAALVFFWPRRRPSLKTIHIVEITSLVIFGLAASFIVVDAVLITAAALAMKGIAGQVFNQISLSIRLGGLWLTLSWISAIAASTAAVLWAIFIFIRRTKRGEAIVEIKQDMKEKDRRQPSIPPINLNKKPLPQRMSQTRTFERSPDAESLYASPRRYKGRDY